MKSFLVNGVIAVIWLLLSETPSISSLIIGFLLGFALLTAFHGVLGSENYIRRSVALVRFLFVFGWEFLVANVIMAHTVLFRSKEALYPNFVTYDVSDLRRHEIMLMYYGISLTPGSAAVQVTDDFRTMIIHVLDARHPEAVRSHLDKVLKTGILSFCR